MRERLRRGLSCLLMICLLIATGSNAWASELPKAPAPTNLRWSTETPGDILWEGVEGFEYYVTIYKGGERFYGSHLSARTGGQYILEASRIINESGVYTFVVNADGDGEQYADSDDVSCAKEYRYVRPNKTLAVPADLTWDDEDTISWTPVDGASGYVAKIYYPEEAYGSGFHVTYLLDTQKASLDCSPYMDAGRIYRVQVSAYSPNIERIANSAESVPSEVYGAEEVAREIAGELEAVVTASPSDARNYIVYDIAKEWLAVAMQASAPVRDMVSLIEAGYQEQRGILFNVNNHSGTGFEGTVSAIGACLNLRSSNGQPSLASGSNAANQVSLNFDNAELKPQYKNKLTYANAFALDISLSINGSRDGWLSAPMLIQIPLPEGMKESELIIFYEKMNRSEAMRPLITYDEAGKAYAAFAVTEPGVFVFAQLAEHTTTSGNNGNSGSSGGSSGGRASGGGSSAYTWKQNETGWWLEAKDGSYPKSAWKAVNGSWYYFDGAGYMTTGWQLVEGKWYYMQPSGAMLASGWVSHNGKWYFLNQDGSMAAGWVKWNDGWYYLAPDSGEMLADTVTPDGYRVDGAGIWIQ